jgi:predicted double-glycine peptidase
MPMLKRMPQATSSRFTALALLCLGIATASPLRAQKNQSSPGAPIRDQEHSFHRHVTSWTKLREQHVVMQQKDYSCGAASLATLLRYHWDDDITELELLQEVVKMLTVAEMKERIKNGLSLTDLRRLATRVGYNASIGELTFEKLSESKVPLVVGIVVNDFDHFVVYRGTDMKFVYLADPARGNLRVPVNEFVKQWQKNMVLVVVPRSGNLERSSPLLVRGDEMMLGESNRQYLRDRLTTLRSGLEP